jgi:cell division protein FtsB
VGLLRGFRISTLIFAVGLVYFAVHFFVGQQGLLSWRAYIQRADELSAQQHELVARRVELEARIQKLQPGKTDVDFIEELAFSQLGLVGPNDILIPLPTPTPNAIQGKDAEGTPTVVPANSQTPNL